MKGRASDANVLLLLVKVNTIFSADVKFTSLDTSLHWRISWKLNFISNTVKLRFQGIVVHLRHMRLELLLEKFVCPVTWRFPHYLQKKHKYEDAAAATNIKHFMYLPSHSITHVHEIQDKSLDSHGSNNYFGTWTRVSKSTRETVKTWMIWASWGSLEMKTSPCSICFPDNIFEGLIAPSE